MMMMMTKGQINVVSTTTTTNTTLPETDPFLMDIDLMRIVITNHLITQVGAVPQISILDALSDGTELKMTTWSDNEVIFTNDDGKVMLIYTYIYSQGQQHLGLHLLLNFELSFGNAGTALEIETGRANTKRFF